MGMLDPLLFLSHHISLQLMLQQEFHVITLALLSCPHERRRGKGNGRTAEEAERDGRGYMRRKKRKDK